MDHLETGAESLLGILTAGPSGYHRFATDYFERELDLAVIEQFYTHQPLDARMVATLNPEIGLGHIWSELFEIGYPTAHRP